jgi:8-hydroxy-5-deazaflavin:NADPH oxidoreductase
MNIGILGTGVVGVTIGTKLAGQGHDVMLGSRTSNNQKALAWAETAGPHASVGTFADAAAHGEVVLNCTGGMVSLDALRMAGAENLKGKILIDLANPLDFSNGFPPSLSVCNTDSLGEQIQREFPEVNVVKTLNTITCFVMINPAAVPGDHTIFVSGNDTDAKKQVVAWLGEWFGWKAENIIDLGDITTARGPEMILPVWVQLYRTFQNPRFNFQVVVGEKP